MNQSPQGEYKRKLRAKEKIRKYIFKKSDDDDHHLLFDVPPGRQYAPPDTCRWTNHIHLHLQSFLRYLNTTDSLT